MQQIRWCSIVIYLHYKHYSFTEYCQDWQVPCDVQTRSKDDGNMFPDLLKIY